MYGKFFDQADLPENIPPPHAKAWSTLFHSYNRGGTLFNWIMCSLASAYHTYKTKNEVRALILASGFLSMSYQEIQMYIWFLRSLKRLHLSEQGLAAYLALKMFEEGLNAVYKFSQDVKAHPISWMVARSLCDGAYSYMQMKRYPHLSLVLVALGNKALNPNDECFSYPSLTAVIAAEQEFITTACRISVMIYTIYVEERYSKII